MISVIISSYNEKNFTALSDSIKSTIGIAHEIIKVDNPGLFGICEAYNKGAKKASHEILCFLHDDIKFLTENWGRRLVAHFKSNKNTGVIGLAGSICKCGMPSSWWQPAVNDVEPKRMNIVQYFTHAKAERIHHYINPANENISLVATLDGVFLAVQKEVWEKNKFDETLLKGFHGYDIDFTLNIGRTRNNYVIYDVTIEHYSEGKTNLDWFKNIVLVHKKWKHLLPVIKSNVVNIKTLKTINRHWFNYLLSTEVTTKKEKKQKLALCFKLLPFLGADSFTLTDIKRLKHLYDN